MTQPAFVTSEAPSGVRLVDARTILTPASGFIRAYRYTLNPYSGCRFACEYCYARAFAPTEQQRRTWGEWASAKQNAASLIARARADGTLRSGDAVYMSSATDPYQPAEQRLRLTRSILETVLEWGGAAAADGTDAEPDRGAGHRPVPALRADPREPHGDDGLGAGAAAVRAERALDPGATTDGARACGGGGADRHLGEPDAADG